MITKNITWNVTSLKGADPFDVVAPNLEEAVCDALVKLGWTISPSLIQSEPESASCIHCGRIYDDANQCLSDDCPSKDEFITSSVLLGLAKDHSLELSLSLNGFLTTRFLSAEHEVLYSHKFGNGEVTYISAQDFLRIYPDTLGKVWRVVRLVSKEPAAHKSLALTIKNLTLSFKGILANCFYLATFSRIFYLG